MGLQLWWLQLQRCGSGVGSTGDSRHLRGWRGRAKEQWKAIMMGEATIGASWARCMERGKAHDRG